MDPIVTPSLITIASLLASGIGQGVGLAGSAKQNQRYNKYLEGMFRKNENYYNTEANTPYLDTEEAKSYLRNILDQTKEMTKDQESKGAITGQSAEKSVATKEALGKNYNTAVTSLAGYGTRRKDSITQNYMNRLGQLDQMKLGQMLQKQGSFDQIGKNSSGLLEMMLLGGTTGAFEGGFNLADLFKRKDMGGMKKSIPGLGAWGN